MSLALEEQPLNRATGERDRFYLKVEKIGQEPYASHSGCWLWRGTINTKSGRGQFMRHGARRHHWASRVCFADVKGSVPAGQDVVRDCANPHCVNPEHHHLRQRGMSICVNGPTGPGE